MDCNPNRFKDHKYIHQETWFKCGHCDKSFHFLSGLSLHRNLHRRIQAYECFAKNCKKRYKWPQDLLRHIKIHLKVKLQCENCYYTTHETRLLCQHKQTHTDNKRFICRMKCNAVFKHAMQCYRHKIKCK